MKRVRFFTVLLLCGFLMACGDGGSNETIGDGGASDLSSQEQTELIAAALSADKGGIEEDIEIVTRAANGDVAQQARMEKSELSFSVSVTADFYDEQDNRQDRYDAETTDRIDYQSIIQGRIENGTGFFNTLEIDNQSDFIVDEILSRLAVIDGMHTNHSSYSRSQVFGNVEVEFEVDSQLILTGVMVDLDDYDTYPEAGTVEGHLEGSYQRTDSFWQQSRQFSFHFIATYLGDNTARVELSDGTVFIVRLDTGAVEDIE